MPMGENSKEIQVVDQDKAVVGVRRSWTRPEIYKSSASSAETSSHANADATANS